MSMSRREMELRIKELFDSEEILIKRIGVLESLLRECADDIESYVEATYTGVRHKGYPSEDARYERDIEIVHRARALLAGEQPDVGAELAHVIVGTPTPVLPRQPYPMCRHPSVCTWAGYCKHDPACNN